MDKKILIQQGPSREQLFDSLRLNYTESNVVFVEKSDTFRSGDRIEVKIDTLSRVDRGVDLFVFSGWIIKFNDQPWSDCLFSAKKYLTGRYDTQGRRGCMKFASEPLVSKVDEDY